MPHGGGRHRRERKGTATGGSKIKATTSTATLSAVLKEIALELMEEIVEDVGLEVGGAHSSGALGALGLLDTEPPSELQIKSQQSIDFEMKQKKPDVFGQDVSKANWDNLYVECASCHKKLAASRFGDHLAKCILGQGRAASPSNRMVEVKVEPGTTSKKRGCGGDPTMPDITTNLQGLEFGFSSSAEGIGGKNNLQEGGYSSGACVGQCCINKRQDK